MKIRLLLLALAATLLMTGCITPGYDYRGDGYYYGGTRVEYRSNRGYPYGYYDDYYRYGYGPSYRYGYGPSYGYPYRYGPSYGYPGPYRYRHVYPRTGHRYDYPRNHPRPPSNHSGGGKPPWRDLGRMRQAEGGQAMLPPRSRPPVSNSAPRAYSPPPQHTYSPAPQPRASDAGSASGQGRSEGRRARADMKSGKR